MHDAYYTILTLNSTHYLPINIPINYIISSTHSFYISPLILSDYDVNYLIYSIFYFPGLGTKRLHIDNIYYYPEKFTYRLYKCVCNKQWTTKIRTNYI